MAVLRYFAVCVLLCVVTCTLVAGDCVIKDPERCDLKSPKVVSSVQFNGTCKEAGVPTLEIGQTYDLNITFTPVQDAQSARSVVKVEVFGLMIPVDIEDPDACVNKGLQCPLKADTKYTFNTIFSINPTYPCYSTLRAKVHWSLLDEPSDQNGVTDGHNKYGDGNVIFCIKLPVEVEPKPSSADAEGEQVGGAEDWAQRVQQEPSFRVVH